MSSVSPQPGWSPSVERALLWASGCASLRGDKELVGSEDLFVGLFLAHADSDGEVWRFLDHFGLKARDLLPDDYPVIDSITLIRVAAGASGPDVGQWSPELSGLMSDAEVISSGSPQVLHVLAVLLRSTPWQVRLATPFARFGLNATALTDQLASEAVRFIDLASSKPAGQQLGEWLEQRFPRTPATMASFSNDVPDPGADFVGVDEEADAFAYLIASRNLVPPLAIGLFGDWGSGKSFLMAKIRQRVGQLTALAVDDATADEIWPKVVSIEFNAWQYVETDLWAALLTRIFDELSPEARSTLTQVGRRHQAIRAEKDANLKAQLTIEKDLAELRALEAQGQKDANDAAAHTELVKEQVAQLQVVAARGALETHARSAVVAGLAGTVVDLDDAAKDAVREAQRLQVAVRDPVWQQRDYWTWWRLVWVVLALVILPVLALVLDRQGYAPLTAVGAAVGTVAVVLAPMLKIAATFLEGQRKSAQAASEQAKAELASSVTAAEKAQAAKEESLAATREKIEAEQRKAQQVAADRVDLDKMASRLSAGTAYADFLSGRTTAADYRKRLGVISTVSDDLRTLSELVAEYNLSAEARKPGGPPNRIVLYIDDLDRCPPRRVLEVLEAVHLLLAFPLFVVVVAVDTRWLTTALHEALPLLEKKAEPGVAAPTAADYLEKIFQIPFWVEPLDEAARQRLLRGVLLPSVGVADGGGAPAKASVLEAGEREQMAAREMLAVHGIWLDRDARQFTITQEELTFIEKLNPLLTGTPRQVKRFVNICKLLLAMSPPLSGGTTLATERTAACFMAAIHQSMSGFALKLAEAAADVPETMTLQAILPRVVGPGMDAERERVQRWMAGGPVAPGLPTPPPPVHFGGATAAMLLKRWDVIRRLRFAEDEIRPADPVPTPQAAPVP
jgi:hypothetical protein